MCVFPLTNLQHIISSFLADFILDANGRTHWEAPTRKCPQGGVDVSTLSMSLEDDEDDADIYGNDVDEKEAMAHMKIICQFAREVLLSHVKSDHNLTVYRK